MKVEARKFSEKEIRCKCGCGAMYVDPDLIISVQAFRNTLCFKYRKDIRIRILSACRCRKHNKDEGGVDDSQHISEEDNLCLALDFWSHDLPAKILYDEAKACGLFSTVIYYIKSQFIHGDIRKREEMSAWEWNK